MADKKAPSPPKEKKPNRPPSWPGALSKAKIERIVMGAIVIADAGANAGSNFFRLHAWENGTPPLGDRLTRAEADMLGKAAAEEAARHPQVLRVIDRLVRLSGKAGLAGAIVLVAIPRLERRNMIPRGLTEMLDRIIESAQTTETGGDGTEVPPAPGEQEPNREAA